MTFETCHKKQRLRAELGGLLREVRPETALACGVSVRAHLEAWPGFEAASEIVAFSSLPGEIDTRPLLAAVRDAGKTLLLPRMVERSLEFVLVDSGSELVAGRYGVLEPSAECVTLRDFERAIVLVPGVGFDLNGGRLGRGAGYYDRALAPLRSKSEDVVLIGVGFALQVVESVPMSSDDQHVDAVLTEDALTWCSAHSD